MDQAVWRGTSSESMTRDWEGGGEWILLLQKILDIVLLAFVAATLFHEMIQMVLLMTGYTTKRQKNTFGMKEYMVGELRLLVMNMWDLPCLM